MADTRPLDAQIDAETYAINAEFDRELRKVFKVKKGRYKAPYDFEDEGGKDHTGTVRVPFIPAPKTARELIESLDAVVLSASAATGTEEVLSAGLVIDQHQTYLETFLAISAVHLDDLRLEHQLALDAMARRDALLTSMEIVEGDIRDNEPEEEEPEDDYDDDEWGSDEYWDAIQAHSFLEGKIGQVTEDLVDYGRITLRDAVKNGW
ncbi:hypothetical protein [Microbacterium sp. 77mftsu3.1]|uniref:hypothetical protein n=1 Tax=Microbacterium sp. 77mftsu3.1 TaxID=1761802 RepID=UPI0003776F6D|nr:hypothetical protein [Microbacterium sp. 77mftsu3.1]SDH55834.1 hypothetical protein SAMN04488590_3573 [Microbacterium sp. 77mftsu3.1]